ncbi:MAG: hypothetical protein UMV23_06190 [Halanaerobium sp.]|nr:hypothetical protein [Halanaerobium sp.]
MMKAKGNAQPDKLKGLQEQLIKDLQAAGAICSKPVEEAFLHIPRHRYLRGMVEPEEAYLDKAVNLKWGISTSSQPQVIALMLEALEPFAGMKVLEIGTASGYNAALLADIAGPDGLVVTLELEEDLAMRAAKLLDEDFSFRVEVHVQDGWKGYQEHAPYDRVIITAEARNISSGIADQTKDGGIIVVPLKIDQRVTLMVSLQKDGAKLEGEFFGFPVSFVPMRGKDRPDSPEGLATSDVIYSGLGWRLWRLSLEEQVGLILQQKVCGSCEAREIYKQWRQAGSPGLADYRLTISEGDWTFTLKE